MIRCRVAAIGMAALMPFTVAGCGDDGKGYKPSGQGGNPTAPPSSVAPASDEFAFPADFKIVFESPPPSKADHQKVISDFRYVFQAYYYTGHTHGKDRRYRSRLGPGARPGEMAALNNLLGKMIKKRWSPAGSVRVFRTHVGGLYGKGAVVETCVDESQLAFKKSQSGKRVAKPAGRKPRHKASAAMRRGDDGIWRLEAYEVKEPPNPQGKECQG